MWKCLTKNEVHTTAGHFLTLTLLQLFYSFHKLFVKWPSDTYVYIHAECINTNGQNRRPIVELKSGKESPYGLTLTPNTVYWTDWKVYVVGITTSPTFDLWSCIHFRPNVQAAFRSTGERLKPLPHVLTGMGRPYGVKSIPEECPVCKLHFVLFSMEFYWKHAICKEFLPSPQLTSKYSEK